MKINEGYPSQFHEDYMKKHKPRFRIIFDNHLTYYYPLKHNGVKNYDVNWYVFNSQINTCFTL